MCEMRSCREFANANTPPMFPSRTRWAYGGVFVLPTLSLPCALALGCHYRHCADVGFTWDVSRLTALAVYVPMALCILQMWATSWHGHN